MYGQRHPTHGRSRSGAGRQGAARTAYAPERVPRRRRRWGKGGARDDAPAHAGLDTNESSSVSYTQ
jgi:hypothetical protein